MRCLPLVAALVPAFLAAPVPALAQVAPVAVQPSPAALALARTLGPLGWVGSASDLGQFVEGLAGRLLNSQLASRGPGCDPQHPQCRAVAERLAREAAPSMMAALREVRIKLLALMIEDQLSADEIAAAQAAAGTPGGLALRRVFAAASDPSRLSPAAMQRAQVLMGSEVPKETDILERFYDATKDLPRVQRRIPPPPMLSPPRKMP